MDANTKYKIFHYAGIALLVIAAVFIWFFMDKMKKEKGKLSFKDLLKKNLAYGGVGAGSLLLSFIAFEVSFFIPGNTNFMLDHAIKTFAPGRLALSYIFVILAAIGWIGIIYGFFIRKNFKEESKLINQTTLITCSVAIPLVIVSTILFLEGNAPYIHYPLVNNLHIGKSGIELTNNYIQTGKDFQGINIAFYAIGILGGAFVVLAVCDHFMYESYGHHGLLYTCFFIAVPCGVIGARIWYVCIDLMDYGAMSQFAQDWTAMFRIWEGGLAIMGGAILGIIGGVTTMLVLTYVLKKPQYKNLKLLHVMDIIIPCILVAQAIGRWGNFFNNEVYGFEVDRANFAFLPSWILNNMQFHSHGGSRLPADKIFLPLFLIESITNALGYIVIYFGFGRGHFSRWFIKFVNLFSKDKQNPIIKAESYHANGTLLGGYLIWYGATRAILEFWRTEADFYMSSVYTAIVMIVAGVLFVAFFIGFDEIYTKRIRVKRLQLAGTNEEVTTIEDEEKTHDGFDVDDETFELNEFDEKKEGEDSEKND